MQIVLRGAAAGYEAEHTARIFFPGAELSHTLPPEEEDLVLAVAHSRAYLVLLRRGGVTCWQTAPASASEQPRDQEYDLCRMLYGLLRRATGIRPPWGMMTGVRPVRIIHDMRAEGATEEEIRRRFLDHFDCTPERWNRALQIADLQRPILEQAAPMDCSVYAGIPFCPSRCSYCSFVSRTVGDKATRALMEPYVDCLCRELQATRRTVDACGLQVKTLYIGGGTPTSLNADQLRRLMQCMADNFDPASLQEFTVEAGRPDCTDEEKLRILKEYGATRISINPQTFSDEVLRAIGRRHTAQEILDCFHTARRVGHDNINMDLIAGLPGDTVEGFRRSLRTAISLEPENITVHTLTLKRASNLVVEHRAAAYDDVAAMVESCELLEQAGYRPYYLYRQKGTLQNLENVGWCKPGYECLYNIYIMEEVHTILSAGAGGSTKLVAPGVRHGRIERIFNYKYPTEYIDRFDTVLSRKEGVNHFYAQYLCND
ncbi:MAG: coproporphyrinogen dehydrogenase HemZ [Gemmiger sp.]|uniref:coproporphyrinogen dehydrogenase HemZ n=1 Tax=Gemmiger sp. TaxID=2049027 RepID=UPI002E77C5B6|nr:coproporphyrinogen dehydrogenase HemZ [Gemmiger sp.]MEE0801440.1 coproporphyrinogen dehydrogenase HemZ [Gemmiger sp.]